MQRQTIASRIKRRLENLWEWITDNLFEIFAVTIVTGMLGMLVFACVMAIKASREKKQFFEEYRQGVYTFVDVDEHNVIFKDKNGVKYRIQIQTSIEKEEK